jgi:hypothetical protein
MSSTVPTTSQSAAKAKAPEASSVKAQANAICTRRNRELAGVPIKQPSLPALAKAATRRAEIERRALSELGELTPPAKVAGKWRKVIANSTKTLQELVRLVKYASLNDTQGVRRQTESSKTPQLRLLIAGAQAGLPHCASVG